jgi:predicted TIM-barrel enzyme
MEDLEAVKRAVPGLPVLANTGVSTTPWPRCCAIADGCVVGSALKVDGHTWNKVDPDRARDFMDRARAARA